MTINKKWRERAEAHAAQALANHVMTVEIDTGVHRCLHFGKPGTGTYSYRLVTWPGHLAISGDLNDYTFSRTPDMFEFFRHNKDLGYIESKVVASRRGGTKAFDVDLFRSALVRVIWEWRAALRKDGVRAADVMRDARERFAYVSSADEAIRGVMAYILPNGYDLDNEFYENNLESLSHGFMFSCLAVFKGLAMYDAHKAALALAEGNDP